MSGTRFPNGVIDGVAHVEAGSANLSAGGTATITTGLDSISGFAATSESATGAVFGITNVANAAGASTIAIKSSIASALKIRYVVVGPRSTVYA